MPDAAETADHALRDSSDATARVQQMIDESLSASLAPIHELLAKLGQRLEPTFLPVGQGAPTPVYSSESAATEPTANPTNHFHRKPLPLPDKFNGKRADFASWKRQMQDKLELDANTIGNNREAWYLINSCLGDSPKKNVATFYEKGGLECGYDPIAFLKYLERTYGNVNLQKDAASKLRTLRQREDQSFASFLPRFERVLAEAGGMP